MFYSFLRFLNQQSYFKTSQKEAPSNTFVQKHQKWIFLAKNASTPTKKSCKIKGNNSRGMKIGLK